MSTEVMREKPISTFTSKTTTTAVTGHSSSNSNNSIASMLPKKVTSCFLKVDDVDVVNKHTLVNNNTSSSNNGKKDLLLSISNHQKSELALLSLPTTHSKTTVAVKEVKEENNNTASSIVSYFSNGTASTGMSSSVIEDFSCCCSISCSTSSSSKTTTPTAIPPLEGNTKLQRQQQQQDDDDDDDDKDKAVVGQELESQSVKSSLLTTHADLVSTHQTLMLTGTSTRTRNGTHTSNSILKATQFDSSLIQNIGWKRLPKLDLDPIIRSNHQQYIMSHQKLHLQQKQQQQQHLEYEGCMRRTNEDNSNDSIVIRNNSTQNRTVQFTFVQIRYYEQTIGDNPSVSIGTPISLDWTYNITNDRYYSVQDYELLYNTIGNNSYSSSSSSCSSPCNKYRQVRLLNYYQRRNILQYRYGVTEQELDVAERMVQKVQFQRTMTHLFLPFSFVEDITSTATRKVRRLLSSPTLRFTSRRPRTATTTSNDQ